MQDTEPGHTFERELAAKLPVSDMQLAAARDHAAVTGLSVMEALVELGYTTADLILAASGGTLATLRPKLAGDVREAEFIDADGAPYWIVHRPGTGRYLLLTERQKFVLDRLDGDHTLAAINIALIRRYQRLENERVTSLIDLLGDAGFLDGVEPRPRSTPPVSPLMRIVRAIWWTKLPIPGIDGLSQVIYRRLGRVLWHQATRAIAPVVAVAGLAAFLRLILSGGSLLSGVPEDPLLFGIASTAAYLVCLALHEAAHALACKRHGLSVPDGGFALYLGLPCFYVTTSACWLAPLPVRLAVSFSGTWANLVIAGAAGLAGCLPGAIGAFWRMLAAMNYLTVLVNLNPLGRFDGYYIAMDMLGMPGLKDRRWQAARAAVRAIIDGSWSQLPRSSRLMFWYVIGGVAYSCVMIALVAGFRKLV